MSRGRVRSTARAWRRTAYVGVAVSGAVLVTGLIAPGISSAQSPTSAESEPFNNGIGQATARSIRINPVLGALSFGIGVGEALANHQNTVGTAEARTANLGVIGVTLAGEGCDGGDPTLPEDQQPIALRTDSNQPGSESGISNADHLIPGIQRTVQATRSPSAEADVNFPGVNIPGVIDIGPVNSQSTSGAFGDYRLATATVTVGHISLFGGLIELDGLKWEAIHRTGTDPQATGSFTIAAAKGPLSIPLPTDAVLGLLDSINTITRPLGLEIRLPKFHLDDTGQKTLATVDPLAVAIVPSVIRDQLVGTLLSTDILGDQSILDIKQQVTNALIAADCGNSTYVTVLDLLLTAVSPGGSFAIELGGVQATTSAIDSFQGGGSTTPTTAHTNTSTPTTAHTNSATATTFRSTATTRQTTNTTGQANTATTAPAETIDDAVDTADVSGERGGPMLAVGAGGLLLLLATAEGDRRKMRKAQRLIPVEG
jgi:hypothetical protein